jgi:hypothetical protein
MRVDNKIEPPDLAPSADAEGAHPVSLSKAAYFLALLGRRGTLMA